MSRFGFKLYQRPNSPFWWVYFSIRGKPYRLSTGIPLARRGEAEKKAAEILVANYEDRGAPVPESVRQLDVKQLGDLWIAQLEQERDDKYVSRATTDLTEYIEQLWTLPTQITVEEWARVAYNPETRAAGTLHHSRGGPLRWGSIAHLANTLKHFLRFCERKGVIVAPEIHSPPVKLVKSDRAPRTAMDKETQEKFLKALLELGETKAHRVYTTLFETWVRKSTLQAMTLRWIDWKAETITLPAKHNKSRRQKVIDMTPRAAEAIRAQMKENSALRPEGPVRLDEAIFGPFEYKRVFPRACGRAGIDLYGLTAHHTTRHSALTWAGGRPEATLSGIMKQAGIDSAQVVEHYLHPSLDAARAITRAP